MSHWLADRCRRRGDDSGFGLIEVIVALTLLALVVVATTPLLVGGLRAGRASALNLQGKALAQERLELMRNLPFHVDRQNGQYVDVLDLYFRDLQASGTLAVNDVCDARSYDAATSTYSCRIDDLGSDYPGFVQTVRATFLDFKRATVVPPPAYDSQTAANDSPASTLLGVVVETAWLQAGRTSTYRLRSHIANAQADTTAVRATLEASAVNVASNLLGGDVLQFEGGLVSGEGSLTTGSTAALTVATARASRSSGLSTSGAGLSLSAPPSKTGTSPSDTSGHTLDGSCALACFGQTAVGGNQDVQITNGLPRVGTASDPAFGALRRTGSNTFRGFTYNNAEPALVDPALRLSGPMVSAGLGSTTEVLNGKGFLDAGGTGATAVRSSAQAAVPVLQVLPTDFAPEGLVQVTLSSSSLTCATGGGVGSVTATWSGEVRHWTQTGIDADGKPIGGYVVRSLAPGAPALPAPSALLVLKVDANGDGLPDGGGVLADRSLADWVQTWSSFTTAAAAATSTGKRTTGDVPAVVSVLTAPTRALDETSAINLAVGSLSCTAEDNR